MCRITAAFSYFVCVISVCRVSSFLCLSLFWQLSFRNAVAVRTADISKVFSFNLDKWEFGGRKFQGITKSSVGELFKN